MTEQQSPKIRAEIRAVEREFFRTVSTLVISAFSLVAALAWNTAITNILQRYIALKPESSISSWVIYAIAVTLLAVIVTIYLGRLAKSNHTEELKKEEK